MVEEQKERIETEMTKLINEVDRSHLRRIQGDMHRCAAACCEDKDASAESVQRCIQNCNRRLEVAQNVVQEEFNHFQNRLQRCIMTCNDTIRDKAGANPSDAEIAKYQKEFEGCARKCVDSHIDLIPNILKKMRETFSKKEFQANYQ